MDHRPSSNPLAPNVEREFANWDKPPTNIELLVDRLSDTQTALRDLDSEEWARDVWSWDSTTCRLVVDGHLYVFPAVEVRVQYREAVDRLAAHLGRAIVSVKDVNESSLLQSDGIDRKSAVRVSNLPEYSYYFAEDVYRYQHCRKCRQLLPSAKTAIELVRRHSFGSTDGLWCSEQCLPSQEKARRVQSERDESAPSVAGISVEAAKSEPLPHPDSVRIVIHKEMHSGRRRFQTPRRRLIGLSDELLSLIDSSRGPLPRGPFVERLLWQTKTIRMAAEEAGIKRPNRPIGVR